MRLSATGSITGKQTNTLQIDNTTGGTVTITNSGTALYPTNGLLFTGTSAITLSGGSLTQANTSGANSDIAVYSSNTAGVTIATAFTTSGTSQRSYAIGGPGNFTFTSSNIGSAGGGGNFFNGPGTVTLRTTGYGPSSAGTVVNGGTVILGTGFALNTAVTRPLAVAAGAIFDINNISIASTAASGVDAINNVGALGGTVQNSGATLTNLTLSLNNGAGDFAGTIGGNINLVLNKQGTTASNSQKLTGVNTYAGTTSVTSNSAAQTTAFLTLGAGGALPATTVVTLGGGAGLATGSGALIPGDANGPANQTIAGLATNGTGAANAVVGGNAAVSTLTVGGAASTIFGGLLGGPSGSQDFLALTRAGTGSPTLTNANTYAGGTTISSGILKVNNTAGSGTGPGAVSVLGGTLGGTGTVGGFVSVGGGGHIAPGNSVGTLTVGTITLAAGAVLDWEFNATPPNDLLVVTGTDGFTINGGGFNLYTEGTPTSFDTVGTYNVIQFAGAVQGTGTGALSVLNQQPGRTYAFGTSGNFVTLTIGTGNAGQPSNWALAGGATWGAGASWSTNPTVPNASAAIANFGAAITAPSTVTLDGTKTAGTLTFANANGGAGSIVLLGNGASGAATATLSDASLLTGGAFALANPITVSSGTNVATGTAYVLTLGGQTDNASTFSGAITLENNLTVSQAATTGTNALLLSGGISGTAAGTGPAGAGTGPGNTGTQVVTFAGPGAMKVSGAIANGGGIVGVRVTAGTATFSTTNSYTGATNVDGGKLIFSASQTLTDLNIADGAIVELNATVPAPALAFEDDGGFVGGDLFAAPGGAQAVPEPGLAALAASGMLALLGRRRQRSV